MICTLAAWQIMLVYCSRADYWKAQLHPKLQSNINIFGQNALVGQKHTHVVKTMIDLDLDLDLDFCNCFDG
jgi:hypothetical protein